MTFEITRNQGSNRGSKVFTAVCVALLMALIGGAYVFWTDRAALLRHLTERDHLAVASVWVMTRQGVDAKTQRQPLIEGLETGQPSLRAACAKALGTLRDHDLVAELGRAATQDTSPTVRLAAVEALTATGDTLARPYIRAALDDPDIEVQSAACRATGVLGFLDLTVLLIEKLGGSNTKLKLAAEAGLECFLRPGEGSRGLEPGQWQQYFATR